MSTAVLVTGGAGFIGRHLAVRLAAEGRAVTVVDSLHPQVHPTQRWPDELDGIDGIVRTVHGDVDDGALLVDVLADVRPTCVVHLAAETGTGQSLRSAARHADVNVGGTARLLDAMTTAADRVDRVDHVVLASSRAVYGEGLWCDADGTVFAPGPRRHDDLLAGRWDHLGPTGLPALPVPHDARSTPTEPSSVYGATKLAQEHLLGAWCAGTGTRLSVLRLQNVYGAGQSLGNAYAGVLTHFARLAVERRAIEVFEDGDIRRDLVHVDDAVAALAAAVRRPPPTRRLLDIGSGRTVTLLSVAAALASTTGAPPPVVSGRFRDGDVRAAGCDPGPATVALGTVPRWTLERGLRALVAATARSLDVPSPAPPALVTPWT